MLDELQVKFTPSQGTLKISNNPHNAMLTRSLVKCLFRQLLEGLEYLHRCDIVHR